jgi:hypothetical protein
MSLFVFKDNYLKFMGSKYFVPNAQLMTMCSYGEKADPIGKPGKLEPKDHLPAPKFDGKVKVLPPILLDSANSSRADFTSQVSAALKVINFSGSLGATYDGLSKQTLKLVQVFMEENDVKVAANSSPKALDNLDGYGGDARIVWSLFIVAEASWSESFTAGTSFTASADAAGIVSVKAAGGGVVGSKSTLVLSPGTCLAYGLLKLDWKDGKISNTHVDEVGMA